jgi:PEP-CTERM motif
MSGVLKAAVAGAFWASATSCFALASATVDVTGDTSLDISSSVTGAYFDLNGPIGIRLGVGETEDFYYNYTVTLSDDGLSAPPAPAYCTPIHDALCTPPATGFEQASATIAVGYRDGRVANPFLGLSEDVVSFAVLSDSSPDLLTESGTLHVHASNLSPNFVESDEFFNYAVAFVNSNPIPPVPEPSSYITVLAGLGLLAAKLVRLRTPPSFSTFLRGQLPQAKTIGRAA